MAPPSLLSLQDADLPSVVTLARPSVMLVRLETAEEALLRLDEVPVRVLRVRHPLPACVRMRIVLPEIVLVGGGVMPRDLGLLLDTAFETGAGILHVSPFTDPAAVRPWILRMVSVVRERRAAPRPRATSEVSFVRKIVGADGWLGADAANGTAG